VALALGVCLSARWLSDSAHQLAQTAAVATVAVIVAAQPALAPSPAHPATAGRASPQAATAPAHVIPTVPSQRPAVPGTVQAPAVQLPVALPVLPSPPIKIKAPQL
jgi:hypothetical protein